MAAGDEYKIPLGADISPLVSELQKGATSLQGLAQTAGNVLVQSIKDQPLYKAEDAVVAGTKNQDFLKTQQLSDQMYNRGQGVLKTPMPTGLQAIPNVNILSPQQLQNNYMQGLRNAQGQFDAQYQWSPGLGWAQ